MEVIVDGIIYERNARGGIARIFNEILPRMCAADSSLDISLFTEGRPAQEIPRHPRIARRVVPAMPAFLERLPFLQAFLPKKRRFMFRRAIGSGGGKIWHSTYYTTLDKWDGVSVVTVLDMIHERFTDLYNRPAHDCFREQKRRAILAADAVLCISESTAQDVQHFYNMKPDRVHVIHLGCSDIFKQLDHGGGALKIPVMEPFLLYVGKRAHNKSHYKNFYNLLEAYSKWSQNKNVKLLVVGKPWSANEKGLLMDLGIGKHVEFLADVDDETLCGLYNQATAFVYPSLYEGFGIPLLEAMACGCPVIASRIPSTVEVAGDCPIYFEPTDVKDLMNAFDVALSEGKNSKRTHASLEMAKRYSWDQTAARTLDVYRSMLGV